MDRLPKEIFMQIVPFLDDASSKQDISRLCLLSKSWLPFVRSILYSWVDLSPIWRLELFYFTLLSHPNYAPLVKSLKLALTSSFFPQQELGQTVSEGDPLSRLTAIVEWTKDTLRYLSLKAEGLDLLDIRQDVFTSAVPIVLSFPHLQSFHLDTFSGMLDLRTLMGMLQQMPHLLDLSLSFIRSSAPLTQDASLLSNVAQQPQYSLQRLSFNYVFLLSAEELKFILGRTERGQQGTLKHLRCCCFTHTTDVVREWGASIEHLSLDNSLGFLDSFIAESQESLQVCQKLQVIVLTGTIARGGVEMLEVVSQTVIKVVLKDLIRLQNLDPFLERLQYNRIASEKDRWSVKCIEVERVVEGWTGIESLAERFTSCGVLLRWTK
ncbi:hypothetical protein BT69DRAFT_1355505 [Atractiella rhizophila]|nr:hypothetical protein BT69DRAFT_1355505 [Atractiella rhizophila]